MVGGDVCLTAWRLTLAASGGASGSRMDREVQEQPLLVLHMGADRAGDGGSGAACFVLVARRELMLARAAPADAS